MFKNITLFFDIETLQYNETAGSQSPSEYKERDLFSGGQLDRKRDSWIWDIPEL